MCTDKVDLYYILHNIHSFVWENIVNNVSSASDMNKINICASITVLFEIFFVSYSLWFFF